MLAVGTNPFGLAILETRGHLSGKTRRVPVGNGRKLNTAHAGDSGGPARAAAAQPRTPALTVAHG